MSDAKSARVLAFRPRAAGEAAPRPHTRMPPVELGAPTSPASATSNDVPRPSDVTPLRRHHGRRIRHSRLPPVLRFGRPFLVALAIIVGPVLLAFWIFRSGVFAVEQLDIDIDGGGRVSDAWVRQTLQPVQGWNLPRLPLAWVDKTLRQHPWIAATALTKRLPDRLGIRVVERREVALARTEDNETGFWYLDVYGQPIAPYRPADGEVDLPLISAGSLVAGAIDSARGDLWPALALYDEIEEVAPDWAGGLSEIEMLGDEDFRVWSADLPFPLLLRSGTLAHKTSFLEVLLPEITRRYTDIEAVDLRFARKIILQPHQRGLGG